MRCVLMFVVVLLVWLNVNVDSHIEDSSANVLDCFINELGEPLYITLLLDQNKIEEAKQLSRVHPDFGNITSYSGYFTVNKSCESNLFFWFFPAQRHWNQAPVVLWLQGGPGASSLYSVFEDVGPLTYKNELGYRLYSWNVENNLLFIDQPVGTGFSFTGKDCYAESDSAAANELYTAVTQFYQLFPELTFNKFFITGHSYAGHYIPALGHTIHINNPSAIVKINLSGMMIGNGWMDAFYQSDYGSYLYQLGLIDDRIQGIFYEWQEKFYEFIKKEEWLNAYECEIAFLAIYETYVGNVSMYNYLKKNFTLKEPYEDFIQTSQIRKAIHVGDRNFKFLCNEVQYSLKLDIMVSVKPWIEELLEHYFIVFYTGQLDIICGYPMVNNFLKALNWSGKEKFRNATRYKWCVEDEQAGFYKSGHNLYDVFVRNAGHVVPHDQPHWAYVLVNSVTSGRPDNPLHALNTC